MNENLTGTANQGKLTEIFIKDIIVPGKQVRSVMDDDHVIELSGSISRNTLLNPILVRPDGKNKYVLVAGFHRLAAVVRLKWKKIPVNIRPPTETPDRVLSLTENLIRKDMSLEEEIEAVNQLTLVEKLSPSQICDMLNRSRAWVDRRLAAPQLPERIRTALFEGLITLGHAEVLAAVADEGFRNSILNNIVYAKLTISQTKEVVQMYLNTPSMASAIRAGTEAHPETEAPAQILRPCTLCGEMQPGTGIIYVPVCSTGCKKKE